MTSLHVLLPCFSMFLTIAWVLLSSCVPLPFHSSLKTAWPKLKTGKHCVSLCNCNKGKRCEGEMKIRSQTGNMSLDEEHFQTCPGSTSCCCMNLCVIRAKDEPGRPHTTSIYCVTTLSQHSCQSLLNSTWLKTHPHVAFVTYSHTSR